MLLLREGMEGMCRYTRVKRKSIFLYGTNIFCLCVYCINADFACSSYFFHILLLMSLQYIKEQMRLLYPFCFFAHTDK